ncbi:hypothetical protein SY83_02895 [Paenibacillus swuensis]|uniref:Lipoprotein n=1 Tax=Paenibacillus swuensis TaxID=1178515 RepID=A0A172TF86_9BACL|nr:hypothetical protein [Paenibacillus swuensis]ANE45443.1 hypothetical protein SY83_02895 [Paenibacillus swuensis]
MKFKLGLLLLLNLLLLTGCFTGESGLSISKENLTLDKVTNALNAEGIEMVPEDIEKDWKLHRIKPHRFSVTQPTEKTINKEYISVYIYRSEQARIKGLQDLNHQKQKYDMQIPLIYEHKNVLILYWHHQNVDDAENAKFNVQIKHALQGL